MKTARLAGLLLFCTLLFSQSRTQASPVVDVFNTRRPANSSQISIATGIFEGYKIDAVSFTIGMVLTLLDPSTGKRTYYYLSDKTTINGVPFQCDSSSTSTYRDVPPTFALAVSSEHMCDTFPPTFIPGKTSVAVLYWELPNCIVGKASFPCPFSSTSGPLLGADEIVAVNL